MIDVDALIGPPVISALRGPADHPARAVLPPRCQDYMRSLDKQPVGGFPERMVCAVATLLRDSGCVPNANEIYVLEKIAEAVDQSTPSINVTLSDAIVDQMIRDRCYRNQHETNTTQAVDMSYDRRVVAEARVFGGVPPTIPEAERPKYLHMNVEEHPNMGDYDYGPVQLCFHARELRDQMTLTPGDSIELTHDGSTPPVSTAQNPTHALLHNREAFHRILEPMIAHAVLHKYKGSLTVSPDDTRREIDAERQKIFRHMPDKWQKCLYLPEMQVWGTLPLKPPFLKEVRVMFHNPLAERLAQGLGVPYKVVAL